MSTPIIRLPKAVKVMLALQPLARKPAQARRRSKAQTELERLIRCRLAALEGPTLKILLVECLERAVGRAATPPRVLAAEH
jgi:hypothetical protein